MKNNQLNFKNGKFKIMLVGDPHEKDFTDDETSISKIKDYMLFQHEVTKKEKPDLIVLMGDNGSSSTPEGLREILLRITSPYRERNIPFSFILGNHDLESKVSNLDTQYFVYKSLPGIVFPDEYTENGDYVLSVKSENNTENLLNLWYFYNGAHPEKDRYSYYSATSKKQIAWYEKKSEELNKNGKITPAIVFQHVPVSEEFNLLKKKSPLSMLTNGVRGLNGYYGKHYVLKKDISGYMGEAPCPADYDCGQFASWQKKGDVIAAFFGHDHMNDFIGKVGDITLAQCKTVSFRAYGDGLRQGVRIIEFNENDIKNFSTKMVYYRDIIGNQCYSIKGRNKIFPDRINVKIDVAENVAKFAVPSATLLSLCLFLKKRK